MPRGGRRPGAGAPKRNLNALKTGERSVQVAAVRALLSTPSIQRLIRELRRRELEQVKRDQQFRSIMDELAERERRQRTIKRKGPSADSEEA